MFIDKEEREENTKWTDRALMLEYGSITSIEISELLYLQIYVQRIF